jgi:hypothetical protein
LGLPLKKKTLLTATFRALLFLVFAQLCVTKLVDANPYLDRVHVPPLVQPSIVVLSPANNNTLFNANNLIISFSAIIKPGREDAWITEVQYNTSWQQNNVTVWRDTNDYTIPEYSGNLSLNGIPEGNQTVTLTVYGHGYYSSDLVLYYFDTVNYCTVVFTVDTVSPEVTVMEMDNKTFIEPEVPLKFTVNEATSKIMYSLDGQENMTVVENTTFTGLSYGVHNVTVYAWDAAGNVGSSETITFTVAEPFPTVPVAAASVVSVALVGVTLLFYSKKRKR